MLASACEIMRLSRKSAHHNMSIGTSKIIRSIERRCTAVPTKVGTAVHRLRNLQFSSQCTNVVWSDAEASKTEEPGAGYESGIFAVLVYMTDEMSLSSLRLVRNGVELAVE